jgi:hypothetical protein
MYIDIGSKEIAMRMEPAKLFVTGCACVFGAMEYAQAQQFVYPVPPPPAPIFNPSIPNTVPQTMETPVSPNARQAPFRGYLRPIDQDLRLTIVSTDENDPENDRGGDANKDGDDADKAGHEKPLESMTRCMPRCALAGRRLHFSRGMGGAAAGRPIAIRFVDNRTIAGGKPLQ